MSHTSDNNPRRWLWCSLLALAGVTSQALSSQSILAAEATSSHFVSRPTWLAVVEFLGGRILESPSLGTLGDVDLLPLFVLWLTISLVGGLPLAWLAGRRARRSGMENLRVAGAASGWWCWTGIWELSRLLAVVVGWQDLDQLLLLTPEMWQAMALAGWLAQLLESPVANTSNDSRHQRPRTLMAMIALFVVLFTAMNWRLWFNLRVPHGDSAMYEEHLWNLTHGKGFRSYLDQGLFLGEHIQVIHLLLLPLHWLWPSHLLLEFCQSLALGLGAIPVFRMTARSTGSDRMALWMAAAYLLYAPMHFLDIEVDLKTFRPESFCVPFFLWAFDALESGRWRRFIVLLLIALSAKEDYSIIVGALGLWIAATAWWSNRRASALPATDQGLRTTRIQWFVGLGLALFGVAYLLLATRVVIPWFRGGAELHYVRYFSKFGSSMSEVVWNMLTKPSLLFGELLTLRTMLFGLSLLLPAGFVSLLSPGRLAVALPLFGILCLNELAADTHHQFHAPLVPVVFWAASAGIANAVRVAECLRTRVRCSTWLLSVTTPDQAVQSLTRFVGASAFASGLFFSFGPLSVIFWDAHASSSFWRLYWPTDSRAVHFSKVLSQIPTTQRVASTDFVHPRFTHHERSYDYSHYRREVAQYEDRVPDDTNFIVIDVRHPYSDIKSPKEVRELRDPRGRWELLEDHTDGHFIVLRRRVTP